jgi:hypothetical protein
VLVLRMALSAGGVWGDGLVRELMQFVDALVAEDQREVTPRESKHMIAVLEAHETATCVVGSNSFELGASGKLKLLAGLCQLIRQFLDQSLVALRSRRPTLRHRRPPFRSRQLAIGSADYAQPLPLAPPALMFSCGHGALADGRPSHDETLGNLCKITSTTGAIGRQ